MRHPPPHLPDKVVIEVRGDLLRPNTLTPADLAQLPRRRILADLHCVAGLSALSLAREGAPFPDRYGILIEPILTPGSHVQYVVFVGLDG